jgi:CheY-like chemotaxis protein
MESKSTILVVDDTPKNIQLVANILGKLDLYTILFAFNGSDALKRVQ